MLKQGSSGDLDGHHFPLSLLSSQYLLGSVADCGYYLLKSLGDHSARSLTFSYLGENFRITSRISTPV